MWSPWIAALVAAVLHVMIGGECGAQLTYRPCTEVDTVPVDVSKLNGTWYVYAYTLPERELDTMCDAYHFSVNSTGTFVNFTYADRLSGEQKSYLAIITLDAAHNGSFLYNMQNKGPDDATIVYVIALDECSFINYGCETSYDHYGALVIATRSRDVFEVNIEQLINKASVAGAPKDNLQIVNQNNCVI